MLTCLVRVVLKHSYIAIFSECRPGYFKLNDDCVANCPEHYYGMMQMVRLRSTNTTSSTQPRFQRQGICNRCHEACRTCKGPHVSDCFQCRDGYQVHEGMCQKKLLLNFIDPDMVGFFIWVIVFCIAAIVLFGVIFGLLHARDRRLLCWKGKRHMDSDKCEYNGISLTQEDIENDLENYDIIRNRNFRHASIPESQDPTVRVHLNSLNKLENDDKIKPARTTSQTKLDHCSSRNNSSRHSSKSGRHEHGYRETPVENGVKKHHSDRRNRYSDKSVSRKHMDSYVSYDINSTLTQTLGTDLAKNGSTPRGHGHSSYHSNRGSGSLRH